MRARKKKSPNEYFTFSFLKYYFALLCRCEANSFDSIEVANTLVEYVNIIAKYTPLCQQSSKCVDQRFCFLSGIFLIRKDFISLTRTHSMVGNEHKEEEDLV